MRALVAAWRADRNANAEPEATGSTARSNATRSTSLSAHQSAVAFLMMGPLWAPVSGRAEAKSAYLGPRHLPRTPRRGLVDGACGPGNRGGSTVRHLPDHDNLSHRQAAARSLRRPSRASAHYCPQTIRVERRASRGPSSVMASAVDGPEAEWRCCVPAWWVRAVRDRFGLVKELAAMPASAADCCAHRPEPSWGQPRRPPRQPG
jgi:hypothetical protein